LANKICSVLFSTSVSIKHQ